MSSIESALNTDAAARWYVVQTKPREELRAVEHLRRQQFECFLPTVSMERRRQGARHIAQEPMFPGYLFVHLDKIHDNWHAIRSTRGVVQMVRFNEYPTPVPDGIIEAIRRQMRGAPITVPYLAPGETVRITEGAFADLEAIFLANDGEERVMLLLSILHREQRLSFPAGAVRKKA